MICRFKISVKFSRPILTVKRGIVTLGWNALTESRSILRHIIFVNVYLSVCQVFTISTN